jgi:hypothetical protein
MKTKTKLQKYKESDLHLIIKLALYLILGTFWISVDGHKIIPAGVVIGFFVSKMEFFRVNKKVEYALLLVGALFGLFGRGIIVSLNLGWIR